MRARHAVVLAAILASSACSVRARAQSLIPQALQPTVLQDTFADGMRDGWASYPLPQEEGYDPSFNPLDEDGVHGLMRTVVPNQGGGLAVGFVRRIHLVPGRQGQIAFRYRLAACDSAANVVVELFWGKHSQRLQIPAQPHGWHSVRLLLPSIDTELTAVAVYADVAHAVEKRPVEFDLAQVGFRGLAVPRLALTEPDALWDAHRSLYYVRSAYEPGQVLKPVFAQHARLTLTAPDGSSRSMADSGSYSFTAADPIGIWTLHAQSARGQSDARLLLQPAHRMGLLFDVPPELTPGLLAQVRERRNQLAAQVHVALGANIASFDAHWLLPGLPSYFALLEPPAELALLDSVLARYAQDKDAEQQARQILRAMSSWPTWVHPWFPAHGYGSYYPVGIVAADLALAREYLGEMLPADEQETLDRALIDKAIVPAYNEFVRADRLPFNASNWIGNTAGGSLLAALTVKDPRIAGYALGLFEKDREHIQATYTPDGDYGEGTSYLCFDLEMTAMVADAARRRLGVNLDLYLLDSDRYLRTAIYGNASILDYGDTHDELESADVFAYMAARGSSAQTLAFYRQYRRPLASRLLPRLLWDREAMERPRTAPLAPVSAIFPERGAAVLRSAPNPDAEIVAMRAGPNFNHNHADQGSLQIASRGELVLGEAGYADYYKDPSYQSYVIQAIGHNVLLVDGNPESQAWPGNRIIGTYPSIASLWLGNSVDVVEAHLESVYRNQLRRYRRRVIFAKGGPVFVLDRIRGNQPHRYTLVWHPSHPPLVTGGSGNRFVIPTSVGPWQVDAFSSAPIVQKLLRSPLPLADYARAEKEPIQPSTRVEVETEHPVADAEFVTVFSPGRTARLQSASVGRCSFGERRLMVVAGNWQLELQAEPGSESDPAMTLLGPASFLLLGGTHVTFKDKMLESDVPVSIEAAYVSGVWSLTLRAKQAGELRLAGFGAKAELQGRILAKAAQPGAKLLLPFAAGTHHWQILP